MLFLYLLSLFLQPAAAGTLRVPADHPTIQAAVRAARDGATILIAPGLYRENIVIEGKTLTLASEKGYEQTVLDGDGQTVLTIEQSPDTKITGLTIQNGDDGISTSSRIQVLDNRFTGNKDAIDYEGGGGVCRGNLFENNRDDAVDLDDDTEVTVEDNVIRDNRDDGIEIRLHPYTGPTLHVVIRNNVITGSGEDGIQFIGYNTNSDRVFRIERNLIADSAMAAVGCMGNENSRENYEAYPLPEPIFLINNTFAGNHYGVTGGAGVVLLNNIFVDTAKAALKKVAGDSVASHNLFWNNGTDFEACGWGEQKALFQDPLIAQDYRLKTGSPCIDAGTDSFEWKGEQVLALGRDSYAGSAPDLGSFESGK
ncbi:MAG: right-handed parallel beta-helix repeat-containing protein [Acidobacteriota bacterium]